MKSGIVYTIVGLALVSVVWNSCSEDFQLTEPRRDIPVVYGFINRTDSAQYIRVERLFVDENIPAVELAKRVDSVYYANAIVKLRNISTGKEYTLEKRDVSLDGYHRSAGPFAQVPNYMYKILTKNIGFGSGDSILLIIDRGDNLPLVKSRIKLIRDFSFTTPKSDIRELSFKPGQAQVFSWAKSGEAGLFNFDIVFDIDEFNAETGLTTNKKLSWNLLASDFKNSVTVYNDEFYRFLNVNLEAAIKYQRTLNSVSLFVKAGGSEIKSFNLLVNANLGITASQEIPRYSNLSEGFGIFSSIHTLTGIYGITAETRGAIDTSSLTRALNFK